MKRKIILMLAIGLSLSSVALGDYKIKQRMTMQGRTIETTVLVKGARQRSESGGMTGMGDVATVEQCDLKRNVQISDGKKLYFIEPFNDGSDASAAADASIQNPKSKIQNQKGGTVTITYNITDTGERKTMFGLQARHLKTVMTMQASPNSCTDTDMQIETDGWYVDLPSFSCPVQPPKNPFAGMNGGRGGCQDKFVMKQSGTGKLGFPLTETRTMKMGGGDDDDENMPAFTQTVETVEFSNATLDAKMFDVPAGYTLAKSSQDLYGKPDMSQMMRGNMNNSDDSMSSTNQKPQMNSNAATMNSKPAAKKAGTVRIGVLAPTNRAGENISTTNMQMFLIQKLTGGSVEAVAVSSEADAKAANCDYVLTSDFSKLKQSTAGKIGGMFGKITGADTSAAQKYDAQVDFKLTNAAGQIILQNKAAQKSESNADRAAETVLALEAQAVLSKAK